MTRTERATSPRAILKDRSESKSGIDKHTPKGGAGTHNWGSLMNERDLEEAAEYDEERDAQADGASRTQAAVPERKTSVSGMTEDEKKQALQFRKNALKSPDVDLAAIARTSGAVSTSPSDTVPITSDADTAKHP